MKDLLEPLFDARLVAKVTGLDLVEQRRGIARGQFATSGFIADPKAGHPRFFSLIAAYEAGLLAMARRGGFEAALVTLAMTRRLEDAGFAAQAKPPRAVEDSKVTYDLADLKRIAAANLPEFSDPTQKPGFWSVKYVLQDGDRSAAWIRWGALRQAYDDEPDAGDEVGVMTWPVSALVRSIDKKLIKEKAEIRSLDFR